MKNKICIFSVVILLCIDAAAQKIAVTFSNGRYRIPVKESTFRYTLPLDLVFERSVFTGKEVSFFSDSNQKNLSGSILFDTTMTKVRIGTNDYYQVSVKAGAIILPGNKQVPLKGQTLSISVNGSPVNMPVRFSSGSTGNVPGNAVMQGASSIIHDAMLLQRTEDPQQKKDILARYGINSAGDISNNAFLNDVLDPDLFSRNDVGGIQSGTDEAIRKGLASVAGLDVTNLADGLAKFIVERTKEELSVTFFSNFKKDLSKYKEIQILFPSTWRLLNLIDEQIYSYSNYIENLREAFRSDFNNLDERIPDLVAAYPQVFNDRFFSAGVALKSASYITTSLRHHEHPGDIIDAFPLSYFNNAPARLEKEMQTIKSSLELLQLLSGSLRASDVTGNDYWVGMDKVRELANDKNALKTYIGLLLEVAYRKYGDIIFNEGGLYKIMNTEKHAAAFDTAYNEYKRFMLTLGNRLNELNRIIQAYAELTSDSMRAEASTQYYTATFDLLRTIMLTEILPLAADVPALAKLEEDARVFFEIGEETVDLVAAVHAGKYNEAVNHLAAMYGDIFPGSDSTLKVLIRYGAFMANMLEAQTSDDVAAVIESAALPVGSARIKRLTPFNVSVNAYCGLFTGNETIKGVSSSGAYFNSYGITSPIGISVSRGHSIFFIGTGKKKWAWSSSVFFSVIDLGALTSYRFNQANDSVASVPSVQLGDLISPGIFYSLGIPQTPISINAGWQVGPLLREVTQTVNTYSQSYTRFSISVVVDIPVFNLYTRPSRSER